MKVLDYFLDTDMDISVLDVCDGTSLSRKTVETVLESLVEKEIIKYTRTIGKSRMYMINKENLIAKKLIELNETVLERQEKIILKNKCPLKKMKQKRIQEVD